jgi:flagellar biosynthesis/type III secretory pathway M-ring protein FliF/YscJ
MADQEVPEEIQDYYQTERRERAGVAWLLAFGTLVVTILLAGGIFFGGRWAYRKIAGDEGTETQEVAQNDQTEQERATESANDKKESEQSNSGGQGGQDNSVQGDANDNNTSPSPTPTPTPTPSTPTTGDTSGDLPGTGPSSTITIFFAVTVLGYLIHRLYTKNQQND